MQNNIQKKTAVWAAINSVEAKKKKSKTKKEENIYIEIIYNQDKLVRKSVRRRVAVSGTHFIGFIFFVIGGMCVCCVCFFFIFVSSMIVLHIFFVSTPPPSANKCCVSIN